MRCHPLRRTSGESTTNSSGLSRAWKSKARMYSGSLVRIGGGSDEMEISVSHRSSVFVGLWKNAASWKRQESKRLGFHFVVSTSKGKSN